MHYDKGRAIHEITHAAVNDHGSLGDWLNDGWSRASIKRRVMYMQSAISVGLVGKEFSQQAELSIQNLKAQLS